MKKRVLVCWVLVLCGRAAPAATYYVSTSGQDSNPGTSETQAWRTISNAAARAVAGDTVYIRAGNYGAEQVVVANSGTAALPLVFEGYRLTPGDNPQMTNTWSDEPDPSFLPLLDGGDRAAGTGVTLHSRQYVTVRNLQVRNYRVGLFGYKGSLLTLENLFAKTFGDVTADYSGVGIALGSLGHSNTVRNCTIVNASAEGLSVSGNRNHLENVRVYCNEGASVNAAMDYYLVVVGNDNVVTNCSVERIGDLPHGGHGIGAKGDCRGNVFSRCRATNLRNGGLYVRHRGAVSNVFESCEVYGGNGITIRDGASTNVFRNCATFGAESAIWFFDTTEDGGAQYCGRGNVIENGLFSGTTGSVVFFNSYDVASPADGNRIVNCTIYGGARLFQCDRENFNNRVENSLVAAVTNYTAGAYPLQVSFQYCHFWTNGFSAPAGTAVQTANPLFADPNATNFTLRSAYGRWDPAAGAWTNDLSTSPAVDAGDPASPCENEPEGTGGRINLGFEGNTPYASKASGALLEFTWTSTVNQAAWTNAASWTGGVAPSPAGSHSLRLTNRTAAAYTSRIHEDWTLHRLAFTGGGGDFRVEGSNRTLRVGQGGIRADRTTGTERYFTLTPALVFTADDVVIGRADGAAGASILVANTLDSSVSGGTRIRVQTGAGSGYLNFNNGTGFSAKSATNLFWSLENSRFAIYTTNLTDALGSNTLTVGGGSFAAASNTQARSHSIGFYSTSAGNVATFDTPIEVDGKTIGHNGANGALRPWTIISQREHASATTMMRTLFRGKWTSTEALTNTSGDGVLQVDGVANNTNRQSWFRQDGSNYTGLAITSDGWNGDVAFNSGYNVIDAPNAFGPGNRLVLNLKNANGTQTPMSNVWLLATHGNDVSGRVRVYGGNVVSNAPGMAAGQIRKGRATIGIEGTGTVAFAGLIGLSRMCDQVAARNANTSYDGYLYAGPGGTARFTGGIADNEIGLRPGVSTNAPALFVRGGGTVVLTNGAATHTNTTRVLENTTLQLDGALTQSRLTIEAGSTLRGGGTAGPPVSVSGVLAPGRGLGTLTANGGVTFSGTGAEFQVELSAVDATCSRLAVGGGLDLGAATTLRLIGGRAGKTYTIATCGSRTGTFASIRTNGLASGLYLLADDLAYGATSLTVRLRSSTQVLLTYRAGAGGALSGELSQSVEPGESGTPVSAIPAANFRFAAWSDGSAQNPRTDTNVWSSLSVTSRFEVLPGYFSLLYEAGANGSLSGATAQAVRPGGSGSAVTALPAAGYRFLQWSDGLTRNPRTDANVASNLAVTALFTIETYTLKYSAGAGGRITGTTPQSVPYGGSGTAVTATPLTNFVFTAWSDGSAANPRTDTAVTQAVSVTASFAPAPGYVSLLYAAGTGGTLSGSTAQAVPAGGNGTPVTANPHLGYRFDRWSDGSAANPRTDTAVSANLAVSALFAALPTPETPTFVTNLLARPAIPHPADPFVQVYVMPGRDSWPLHGFRTHGIMTQSHWESVFGHIGHLSSFSLVNTYYAPVGEPWENGYDSLMGYRAAEGLGRPTAGGLSKLPETATEEGRIRALYADPHGLSMKYYFHDAEEEMIDQVPGGSGSGRLRGSTWAVNWTNEASMRTAASPDFNCATNGRLRSFSLSFGLFVGNDLYGNWPYTRLAAVGTATNGWQVEFKSTGWKGSNTVRFITYRNGAADIAESPSWSYANALYWRTVTVTAATNPGDPSKLDVEVKVEPAGDDTVYARTTTVNRPNAYADSPLYLLTTRAQNAASQMRDLDDFVLRDYTGAPLVAYDFEPETPGPILETLPIGTVPDRSGNGHSLSAPPGAETNFTRRPTHGIRPELRANMSKWLVDELLAARAAAGRPPPELIDNWRISETPGRLAAWQEEGFTHGSGSEAYWLNPTLAAGENKVIALVRRGSAPTRFAWADGSDWSHLWLGNEYSTNVPAASEYGDLVALQVLQGVRWFIVFTSMSNGHLAEYTLENDPAAIAVFNAEAVYNMCRVAAWYQPTAATLADSVLTAEKYGDAAIGTDTLYIRRDNPATKEAWFAAIKVAGTGLAEVVLPAPLGRVRNLKTGAETAVTNGLFSLPLTQSAEPYHFQAEYRLTYAAGAGGSISGASTQTVAHGGSGTAVTAVPDAGQFFLRWSDGARANPRTDAGVTGSAAVSAEFARLPRLTIAPEGLEAIGLTWNTAGGARYRLQYADGGAGGSYAPDAFADLERPEAEETAGGAPGAEGVMDYTDDGSGTGGPPVSGFRAYRVRILPANG